LSTAQLNRNRRTQRRISTQRPQSQAAQRSQRRGRDGVSFKVFALSVGVAPPPCDKQQDFFAVFARLGFAIFALKLFVVFVVAFLGRDFSAMETILAKQQVARLLPARNASRSDAQAGEDGLFGS